MMTVLTSHSFYINRSTFLFFFFVFSFAHLPVNEKKEEKLYYENVMNDGIEFKGNNQFNLKITAKYSSL